jgi:hypothetical protein
MKKPINISLGNINGIKHILRLLCLKELKV